MRLQMRAAAAADNMKQIPYAGSDGRRPPARTEFAGRGGWLKTEICGIEKSARSRAAEDSVAEILNGRETAQSLIDALAAAKNGRAARRAAFDEWLRGGGRTIERESFLRAVDFVKRAALYPWTGVYLDSNANLLVTIVGNRANVSKSVIYVNDARIVDFRYENGVISWKSSVGNASEGILRPGTDRAGRRLLSGKIWTNGASLPARDNVCAREVDPERGKFARVIGDCRKITDLSQISGEYAVRTNGRFSKTVNRFEIGSEGLTINRKKADIFRFANGKLFWFGGNRGCFSGEVDFLTDPLFKTAELCGTSRSEAAEGVLKCYGSAVVKGAPAYAGPTLPVWAGTHLAEIVRRNSAKGGLLLWHKWEKHNFTSAAVNRIAAELKQPGII